MGFECESRSGSWINVSCVFISLHIRLLRKKEQPLIASSVCGASVHHVLGDHDSPGKWGYTCHLQGRCLRLEEVASCPAAKQAGEERWCGSPVLALLSMALSPVHPAG